MSERTWWRQFAAQRRDCKKKSRFGPLNAIVVVVVVIIITTTRGARVNRTESTGEMTATPPGWKVGTPS